MVSIGRIDQAVILLQDRLRRLGAKSTSAAGAAIFTGSSDNDPVESLRQLYRRGQLGPEDLRRTFIRALLIDAFGDNLSGSFEFQAMTDQVYHIVSDNEAGRKLLDRALVEIGLEP